MNIKEVCERTGLSQDTLRYYEKVGMIPKVKRSAGNIRTYDEEDLGWIELAKCMRSAGLPVDVMVEYLRLYREGDSTINDRLQLLKNQMDVLTQQKQAIEDTMDKLSYKIKVYEKAVETGKLEW
ncbi:MAG: MerR family transcriptional regulator [Holdemanella sp.]|nr:MerR family transcriptional regulator [Holdemanella sp.]